MVVERVETTLFKMSKKVSKELPFELRSGLSGSQACENMGHEFPSRENISTLSLKSDTLVISSFIKEGHNEQGGWKINSCRLS